MPIALLDERLVFPPAAEADESGIVAVGGDLSPERLLLAYSRGIFPWFDEGDPILWHSPDPRMVLDARRLHVPRSVEKAMRRGAFEIRLDTDFRGVIEGCAASPRPGQRGTWISPEMIAAYTRLHEMGYAHCAEAWAGRELAGGLYGISLGAAFFGESMFARAPDASKIAFVTLVRWMLSRGIALVDCQVHTEHLARFGAEEWPRARYLAALERALESPTIRGKWSLDAG